MKRSLFIALVVSLGGFLFGFDAGIISGVMTFAGPEFDLTVHQIGWATSAPSFAAMFTMLISGRLSDIKGRKKLLVLVAFLYAISAVLSAYAVGYHMLWIARFIGGIAFGAALILAPTYIAEISQAENRGKLVSIQQLNIVLGFFAAFLSNYFFNEAYVSSLSPYLNEFNVWRWMLGVEFIPAVLYFIALFFIPESPRWLILQNRKEEAMAILENIHGRDLAIKESHAIAESIDKANKLQSNKEVRIGDLIKPALRFVMTLGLIIGVLQQITGINAVYFYATSIFKQTGVGTDAAFSSGILLSLTSLIFTVIAIVLIDKMGRRPLLIFGIAGIAVSMLLCSYGFKTATYHLSADDISVLQIENKSKLLQYSDTIFNDDVSFKTAIRSALGDQEYSKNDGLILELATNMNASLVLIGILGFVACFAFSIGPVMWVMLSELFPNRYRGLAIGFVGFINSFVSWLVQQIFPWELSTLGNAMSFFIFGALALIGFVILLKILPETKGKSLEDIEHDFIKN